MDRHEFELHLSLTGTQKNFIVLPAHRIGTGARGSIQDFTKHDTTAPFPHCERKSLLRVASTNFLEAKIVDDDFQKGRLLRSRCCNRVGVSVSNNWGELLHWQTIAASDQGDNFQAQ
eukprot:jgi/Psemu1/27425/gm1.27425_g